MRSETQDPVALVAEEDPTSLEAEARQNPVDRDVEDPIRIILDLEACRDVREDLELSLALGELLPRCQASHTRRASPGPTVGRGRGNRGGTTGRQGPLGRLRAFVAPIHDNSMSGRGLDGKPPPPRSEATRTQGGPGS